MTTYVEYDLDANAYVLMCADGKMSPTPAGPRLFRAPPYPAIKFSHTDPAEAEADAAKLRKYLPGLPTKKQTKKELREVGS